MAEIDQPASPQHVLVTVLVRPHVAEVLLAGVQPLGAGGLSVLLEPNSALRSRTQVARTSIDRGIVVEVLQDGHTAFASVGEGERSVEVAGHTVLLRQVVVTGPETNNYKLLLPQWIVLKSTCAVSINGSVTKSVCFTTLLFHKFDLRGKTNVLWDPFHLDCKHAYLFV